MTDPDPTRWQTAPGAVPFARGQVAYYAAQLAAWQAHLADALAERGSRPTDGSDQARLFEVESQQEIPF